MSDDPIHECFAVLRAVVQTAGTNGIPTAENAIDGHIAFFQKDQQFAALTILGRDFTTLWPTTPSREQQSLLETIGDYIAKRSEEIRSRDAAQTP
jgi:hypothetical protein